MTVIDSLQGLYPGMIEGWRDLAAFDLRATVDSPLGGRQDPRAFLAETRGWLAHHSARCEAVHTTETPERVIHELNLYLDLNTIETELPVMLVGDVADGHIRDLRVYHSTWPLTGRHAVRPPLMQYSVAQRPAEPVGTYHEALANGDAEAADAVYEPDGSVREPAGGQWEYRGADRTAWYRAILSQGPIILHLGTITDDGETVVYEYMADRWGAEPMTPQAGAAAYQRGPSGKLCSARIYDDVEPPETLASW
jgi:hypothetical protein